jgi:hypothetical protein
MLKSILHFKYIAYWINYTEKHHNFPKFLFFNRNREDHEHNLLLLFAKTFGFAQRKLTDVEIEREKQEMRA